MTEKEKTLELVMKHFMATGEKMSQSKNEMEISHANQWHYAACEVAGLGAAVSTIDWAVGEYLKKSQNSIFGSHDFKLALVMVLQGASDEVAEEVVEVAVKYHSHIWALEKLMEYLRRKPTEEEIFSLVEVERANTATLSESHHKKLIEFAGKHLPVGKVRLIKNILDEKIREFNSHSD